MSDYIDYDTVHKDFQKLYEFITDELEIKSYREVILLLQYTQKNLEPEQQVSESEAGGELDYVG